MRLKYPIAVIAGNYQQFRDWLKDRDDPSQYRYIDSVEKTRGVYFSGVVTTGTWAKNPDSLDLYYAVRERFRHSRDTG